jgi:hypothetical protein
LWGNEALANAQVGLEAGAEVEIVHCNVEDGLPGFSMMSSDPLFVDAAAEDYRLSPSSPCIDAGGTPTDVPPAGLRDLDGHARVLCGCVDLGAYEFGIGDVDCDRVVDVADFVAGVECVTGPGGASERSGCRALDYAYDGDVDLADMAGFQRACWW